MEGATVKEGKEVTIVREMLAGQRHASEVSVSTFERAFEEVDDARIRALLDAERAREERNRVGVEIRRELLGATATERLRDEFAMRAMPLLEWAYTNKEP